ncbi:hypothetical protein Tco_1060041, partial [Tanacetum coccineum]
FALERSCKRGKLNLRYVGPFKVLEKVGSVAYKLELSEELSRVHNTFHVSNMKKCYAEEPLAVPLELSNRSDVNCGFRAVALGLGLPEDHWPRIRSDLMRELETCQRQYMYVFGTVGYEKIYSTVKFAGRWMEMPDTGLVIALAYNKVVVNLSNAGGCNTSFPLWSRPPQIESRETIVVAQVDGNHYIRVALREGFPLPLTHPLWITYRSDVASGWEDKFISRQNEFREYYYRTPESYDLT